MRNIYDSNCSLTEKQSSISKSTLIAKIEKFEKKTSCKYTEKSHISKMAKTDTPPMILSAFSGSTVKYRNAFNAPAPSRIEAGYRFIKERRMLETTKKVTASLFIGKISARAAVAKLKIIPPRQTKISRP